MKNTCPNCGYCPHCGRKDAAPYPYTQFPYSPYVPWTVPYTYPTWGYQSPTTVTGTGKYSNSNVQYSNISEGD